MQISLRHISPSKRAFEKYKPRGLFLDSYGIKFSRESSLGISLVFI